MQYMSICIHNSLYFYYRLNDPLFYLATPLLKSELDTVHKKLLVEPPGYDRKQMEERYGPRCYTFPSYIHPNRVHQQNKQWKARKTKPSAPLKKPTVTGKRDVKELRKKAIKEQPIRPKRHCAIRKVRPEMVAASKVRNRKSKAAVRATTLKTNGLKKSSKIKTNNSRVLMPPKHSTEFEVMSEVSKSDTDSTDAMSDPYLVDVDEKPETEMLNKACERTIVKSSDVNDEMLNNEDLMQTAELLASAQTMGDDDKKDNLRDMMQQSEQLHTCTDGTVGLLQESFERKKSTDLSVTADTALLGGLVDDALQDISQTVTSDNKNTGTATSSSLTETTASSTPVITAEVNDIKAKTEISSLVHKSTESRLLSEQQCSDCNPRQDQDHVDAEQARSCYGNTSMNNSNGANLFLLSSASAQAYDRPNSEAGRHSVSSAPECDLQVIPRSKISAKGVNNGSSNNLQSPRVSCPTSVMNNQALTDLNACTTMEVRHLRLPNVPVMRSLQSSSGLQSATPSYLVTTSQNPVGQSVTMSTTVPMVTMTVSEYLSSISSKRAAANTTTTTDSHHTSPASYIHGSNQYHSPQLHISADQSPQHSSLTPRQLTESALPSSYYATQGLLKAGALEMRPNVLLSQNGFAASMPSGYVQPTQLSATASSCSQITAVSFASVQPGLASSTRAPHMQLPVQLPTQPDRPVQGTTVMEVDQCSPKKKQKNKVFRGGIPVTHSIPPPLLPLVKEQKSPTKRKANTSAQGVASKASRMKNPTDIQAIKAAKAPLGSPDPVIYKYLSDCLMRNIQLITGLPVMPLPQPGSLAQDEIQAVSSALNTTSDIANTVTQIITSPILTTPVVSKGKTTRSKKQKSTKRLDGLHQPSDRAGNISASVSCMSQQTVLQTNPQVVASNLQVGITQSITVPTTAVSSNTGQQLACPPPAHQAITQLQQTAGSPSPAHQGSAHHILNPSIQQMAAADPTHVAAIQQMMTLQGMGTQHPMTGMPQGVVTASEGQQLLLANSSGHAALLQNKSQSQQQLTTSTATAASTAISSTLLGKQNSQSAVSCPNIVAALGKPPHYSIWPMMLSQSSSNSQPTVQNVAADGKCSGYPTTHQSSEGQVSDQLLACSQTMQNQEALKKSLHIKKILAHLQKATPGMPLPPYMYDNKTQTTSSASSAKIHHTLSPSLVSTQLTPTVQTLGSTHEQHKSIEQTTAIQDPQRKVLSPVTQMLQSNSMSDVCYSVQSGQLAWQQPSISTVAGGAVPLGGSAPAALLAHSLQESAIHDSNSQGGLQGVTPVSSLSHSGSFDSMHSQVVSSEDSSVLMSQFNNQLNESPDANMCYETYLIDSSVSGEEESSALQQAQAAVLQQLAYRNEASDNTQAVVVMDTQEVPFLDDIECEIEIHDGESLPEPSITEGIVDDVGVLTADNATPVPLVDVQPTPNTGPSVYTETVSEQAPDDGQIGQLGMSLSGDVDLAVTGTNMWDAQSGSQAQLVSGNPIQVSASPNPGSQPVPHVANESKLAEEQPQTAPGWFGKGLGVKKTRRKKSK